MTMTGNLGNTPPNPAPGDQPQLNCLAQYIKDFSFENPNAPRSLAPMATPPAINVQVNVKVTPLAENDFEVVVGLEGKAESSGTVLYSFELAFAGVFRIMNIPREAAQQIVMVDCPHLLFPFAREIVASAVGNSGFPPLLLGPINFFGLYQQQLAAAVAQKPATPAN
jgi:preprotein translocase subunit SecB